MRIIQSSFVLAVGLALSVLVGCQQGPTDAEIEAKITAKIEAMGLSAPAAAETAKPGQKTTSTKAGTKTTAAGSSTGATTHSEGEEETTVTGAGLSDKSKTLATASLDFIKELSVLMADYKPELPDQVDNTDLLRCVTGQRRGVDGGLEQLWKSLEKERKASAKERKQTKREFFRRIYPVNFRIDYQWKTRPGFVKEVTYGCWTHNDEYDYYWQSDCNKSCCYGDNERWKVRSSRWVETTDFFLYSHSTTPEPPEMMKRMEAANVQTPERFYCVVEDAFTKGKQEKTHWITCQSPWEGEPQLRLSAAHPGVQRGDLVSVPLAGVNRSDGVLLKVHKRRRTYLWTVDAAADTLKIEEATTACPEPKEVASAVCRLANKKSDPMSVVQNCAGAGNHKILKEFALKWHKRLRKNKNNVMIKATGSLMTLTPDDLWAPFHHAIYLLKEKRGSEAIVSLKIVYQKSSDQKMQLKVAEHAKKAGDDALWQVAVKKACDLGHKGACGLLGTE